MLTRRKVLLVSILLGLGFVLFGYKSVSNYFIYNGEKLYKQNVDHGKSESFLPISSLINNASLNKLPHISQSFQSEELCEEFLSLFKNGIEINDVLFQETVDDYVFNLILAKKNFATIRFETEYSKVKKRYHIKDFKVVKISSNLQQFVDDNLIKYVDDLNSYKCISSEGSIYNFIRLKTKDSHGNIMPAEPLGSYAFEFPLVVSDDYYLTSAFKQIPFDVRTVEEYSFDPGYVISASDTEANGLGRLFSSLVDGDGTLEVQNEKGERVSFPTGFLIDKESERIIVVTNSNKVKMYDKPDNVLGKPIALKFIGNFLYVLDQRNDVIHYIKVSTSDDNIHLEFIGTLNLPFQLDGASDISGYEGIEDNYLFISNIKKGEINKIAISKEGGAYIQNSSSVLNQYKDPYGKIRNISGGISRIEVVPDGESEQDFRLVAISNTNTILSFSSYFDGLYKIQMDYMTYLPGKSSLSNIGYNLSDKTFFLTDVSGKIHVTSFAGEYLGSGGKFGINPANEELYYPNIITSNFFANDALELIVGNAWGSETGFKRIIPAPDLGKVDVLEKVASDPRSFENNRLLIRYGLTSGIGVEKLVISLNDQEIEVKDNGFYAQIYSSDMNITELLSKNSLKEGWNNLKVEVNYRILSETNSWTRSKREKEIQFYYSPSKINLSEANKGHNLLQGDGNGEIHLYKSLFISGVGNLDLGANKTFVFHPGTVLEFDDSVSFDIKDSHFNLMCGSRIKIKAVKEVPKRFFNCIFDGMGENMNLISIYGEFTGGDGAGSAPSSMIEIVGSKFNSYYGKAIHLIEGRATVVNCEFKSHNNNNSFTSTGILCSPNSRLDILGSTFLNNDIGIESTLSKIIINRKKGKYKGVELAESQFTDNKIGVYSLGSSLRIENTLFSSSEAAIINIEGELDISKKANNIFIENIYSIVTTQFVNGARGENQFIDSKTDLILLQEGGDYLDYNFTCNLWSKQGVTGK